MKKQNSRLCKHSAERIKKLLDTSRNHLLSYSVMLVRQNKFPITHKCDHVRMPKIVSHMGRQSIQEFHIAKHKKTKQLSTSPLDQEVASTQCCINHKHINRFSSCKPDHEILSGRTIRRRFREYFLASKQLKMISSKEMPNPKKYQIALIKEDSSEDRLQDNHQIDWMPLKMEERHFLMGHTVKTTTR